MLRDLLAGELEYAERDGDRFLDAAQNARLVADAERYYRAMYYGAGESWNLRDRHMFDTLERCSRSTGPTSKAVVWAHNSHLGDARATEMGARGELNVGQLCRRALRRRGATCRLRHRPRHRRRRARLGRADAGHDASARRTPRATSGSATTSGVPALPAAARASRARGRARRAGATAARARHRRDLPAGDRAREPLLPGVAARPVRRVRLVRRDRARSRRSASSHADRLPDTYPFGLGSGHRTAFAVACLLQVPGAAASHR